MSASPAPPSPSALPSADNGQDTVKRSIADSAVATSVSGGSSTTASTTGSGAPGPMAASTVPLVPTVSTNLMSPSHGGQSPHMLRERDASFRTDASDISVSSYPASPAYFSGDETAYVHCVTSTDGLSHFTHHVSLEQTIVDTTRSHSTASRAFTQRQCQAQDRHSSD